MAVVPTMGALHEGHLALVHAARSHADAVAATIFVNPLQFNNSEDLAHYPRQPEEDLRLLREAGAGMVLMPLREEIFSEFTPRHYDLGGLDAILEGASRPGHFQGVANVVERIFHYVRPDVALFGEKDRQQLAVIRHIAGRAHWPVHIVGHPVVRAPDGLALSSRNLRLSPAERQLAPALYRALRAVRDAAFRLPVEECLAAGMAVLQQAGGITPDYLVVADPHTLQPLSAWQGLREAAVLVAAQVGPVRLIDNITVHR